MLEAYERMMLRGTEWAQLRRGSVELLTVPSIAHQLLPALVREFTAAHAGVSIELHDHADPILRQRLERGEADLAILTQSGPATSPTLLPFLRDRLRVELPHNHPLASKNTIEASQRAGERMILLRQGALLRSYMDAAISGLPFAREPIEVDQSSTLIGMVEAGLGVSLLPALSCPRPALNSVVSRPLARREVSRILAFALLPDREPMPAVQAFVRSAFDYLGGNLDQLPEGCKLLPASAQRVRKFLAARPAAPSVRSARAVKV